MNYLKQKNMKSVKEFVKLMVKVEFIEDSNCFGHYPFQLFAEMDDGKNEINALALGGDVKSCYKRFSHYKKNNAKRIYLSLDFPKGGDMENDFVAILSFENNETKLHAIPYQVSDGKILKAVEESEHLDNIKSQLQKFI
jgi:hypothetical protein